MPQPHDNKRARLVSVSEAARMLGKSDATVRTMCEDGRLSWEAMWDGKHGVYCIRKRSVENAARRENIG